MMNIRPVTGQPGDLLLPESIAQILHQEWQELPQWQTPEIILARLIKRMNGDNGEMLFVATDKNGRLSGTASLIWRELKTCRMANADWWAGEIYTLPALNLYTPDKQAMYTRMGWQAMYDDVINDELVTVMQRTVSEA